MCATSGFHVLGFLLLSILPITASLSVSERNATAATSVAAELHAAWARQGGAAELPAAIVEAYRSDVDDVQEFFDWESAAQNGTASPRARSRRKVMRRRPMRRSGFSPTSSDIDSERVRLGEALEWPVLAVAFAIFSLLNFYVLYFIPIANELNNVLVVCFFLGLATMFNTLVYLSAGQEVAVTWFVGYLEELVFSLENIFVFHAVIQKFATPPRNTITALIWTVNCQIPFQAFCYMGLSDFLKSLSGLPYILGIWLVYVGFSSLQGDHAHSEPIYSPKKISEGVNAKGHEPPIHVAESPVTWFIQKCFGERFWPHYLLNNSPAIFFKDPKGRWHMTLLGPVTLSLVLLDFCFEIDCTVAKIEAIDNHYIAFSSSVLAAFAVPSLYFIVRSMFERYFLLSYGISFVLVFFGMQLMLANVVEITALAGVCVVISVMVGCVIFSVLAGMGPGERISWAKEERDPPEVLASVVQVI